MAQSSTKTNSVIAVVILVSCLGVGYLVTTPQWNTYSSLRQQLQQAQQDKADYNTALSTMQAFLTDYDSHQKDAQAVNAALPVKTPDLADFTSSLGDLAKSSGIVLTSLQVQDKINLDKQPAENSILTQGITFAAAGSYPSFKDFILRLENHLRLIDIKHMSMKADDNGLIQYQVELKTYYQK